MCAAWRRSSEGAAPAFSFGRNDFSERVNKRMSDFRMKIHTLFVNEGPRSLDETPSGAVALNFTAAASNAAALLTVGALTDEPPVQSVA